MVPAAPFPPTSATPSPAGYAARDNREAVVNRRSLVWVGLFGGLAAVLLVWLFTSGQNGDDSGATELATKDRPSARKAAPGGVDRMTDKVRRLTAGDVDGLPIGRLDDVPDRRVIGRETLVAAKASDPFTSDAEGLALALQAQQKNLDACFRTARFHSPDLPEDLRLTVEIRADADGVAVHDVEALAQRDADTSMLASCLLTVLREVPFEGPPATLSQPVTLSADKR